VTDLVYGDLPGFAGATEALGETTVTIETARIRDACAVARDELGFQMLVDVVATDYLNWGARGVSGYIATATGRDINFPMTQGLQSLPASKPRCASRRHACACSAGSTTGSRCRASSPSGRPRTGTSASSSI
jgi:hypothetical protein